MSVGARWKLGGGEGRVTWVMRLSRERFFCRLALLASSASGIRGQASLENRDCRRGEIGSGSMLDTETSGDRSVGSGNLVDPVISATEADGFAIVLRFRRIIVRLDMVPRFTKLGKIDFSTSASFFGFHSVCFSFPFCRLLLGNERWQRSNRLERTRT